MQACVMCVLMFPYVYICAPAREEGQGMQALQHQHTAARVGGVDSLWRTALEHHEEALPMQLHEPRHTAGLKERILVPSCEVGPGAERALHVLLQELAIQVHGLHSCLGHLQRRGVVPLSCGDLGVGLG